MSAPTGQLHNHSGNIHVHIVINSLRIEEVPLLPYMDRPADTRAGCKHRCTDAAMRHFRAEVMEMCHREGLYQIDLLNGSANRVTEREYWAKKKGQAQLDKENAALAAEGKPASPTKFETDKEKLRQTIRSALSSAVSFEDFAALLLREGVTVKSRDGCPTYAGQDESHHRRKWGTPLTALLSSPRWSRTPPEQGNSRSRTTAAAKHFGAVTEGKSPENRPRK